MAVSRFLRGYGLTTVYYRPGEGPSIVTPRAERLGFLAYLVTSALFAYWFAWVAISALLHPRLDSGGHLVLYSAQAGHTAYPFTYAAAAVAMIGIAVAIYFAEKPRRDAIVIALLASYLTCVGMINLYEQVFLACTAAATHSTYWWTVDFGSVDATIFTVIGIAWLGASAPWWRRENAKLAAILAGLFGAAMLAWLAIGFPIVEQGNPLVYLLNTVSRFASELIPLSLVLPPRYTAKLFAAPRWLKTRLAWKVRAESTGSNPIES